MIDVIFLLVIEFKAVVVGQCLTVNTMVVGLNPIREN